MLKRSVVFQTIKINRDSCKGSDPKTNFSLKAVVDRAKASNMPVANIEKAIKKGSGLGGTPVV